MLPNFLKIIKLARNISKIWQSVCKELILTLVYLVVSLCEWIRSTYGHDVKMIWQYASLLPRSNLFLWFDNSTRSSFYRIRRCSNGNSGCKVPGNVLPSMTEAETSEIHCLFRQNNITEERNPGHTASKTSNLDISINGEHQNAQRTVSADTTVLCPLTPQFCVRWHHSSVSADTTVLCTLTPQFCVRWHHNSVSPDTTALCPPDTTVLCPLTPQFCVPWYHNFCPLTPQFCVPWHHSSVSADNSSLSPNTTVLCPLTPQFCVPWHNSSVSADTTVLCPLTPQSCAPWHHSSVSADTTVSRWAPVSLQIISYQCST
jgi:hypothetical protein